MTRWLLSAPLIALTVFACSSCEEVSSPSLGSEKVELSRVAGVPRGARCAIPENPCAKGLVCFKGRCESKFNAKLHAKEQSLKEQSLRSPPPRVVDRALPGAVIVRSATGERTVWASCSENERLVGGGCEHGGGNAVSVSRPEEHSPTDTLGARWRCGITGPYRPYSNGSVRAFALCQRPYRVGVAEKPPKGAAQ